MLRRGSGRSPAETLRPMLLGSVEMDLWRPNDDARGEVATRFVEAREALRNGQPAEAIALWRQITALPNTEPRDVLQAWTFLRLHGVSPEPGIEGTVLGVVVEVPMNSGVDVLAAYRDGSVRYLNYSGNVIVLDDTPETRDAVALVIEAGQTLADQIGAWDGLDLPVLPAGHSRLLMLTPGGFRFGQGPDSQLRHQAMAKSLFDAAARLLVVVVDLGRPTRD